MLSGDFDKPVNSNIPHFESRRCAMKTAGVSIIK